MRQQHSPPVRFEAEVDRLIALYGRGRLEQVVAGAKALTRQFPRSATPYNILGAACIGLNDHARAQAAYARAATLDPDDAEVHNNHGVALSGQGRLADAVAAFTRALALGPGYAEAWYNLANAYRKQHAIAAAIEAYRRVLALRPDDVDSYNNLGLSYREQGRLDDALAAYGRALAIKPDAPDVLHNLGVLFMELKNFDGAIKAYGLALAIDPARADARGQLLYAKAHVCDFSVFDDYRRQLAEGLLEPGQVSPFTMLVFADDPASQLAYSRAWPGASGRTPATLPVAPKAPGERVRIGYFSADFHDHATLCLMAGLFREHDRDRFEIVAYSYGPECDGPMREQLIGDVDRFADIKDMTDAEVVALARAEALDIAVDLKGYTQHSRSRIFVPRLAPVQVAYVGYPGSMGADFIDYLIADAVVVPPAERGFYREKIVTLPGSYQPNDDRRPIIASEASRAELGLPEQGFVFCCFNQTYKISPREFAIWMRLLDQVACSVLWLLRSNAWTEDNLRREAAARGVDPDRLVFAETLPHHEHLGRLRHADLFLDTFNVNAHTTASDALWAGLPVLTLAGRQFAARVGASLVTAAGLPELVTTSAEAYEARALELATTPGMLAGLRARLATDRPGLPLFATAAYTRKLEAAYLAMHARRLAGLAPEDIAID